MISPPNTSERTMKTVVGRATIRIQIPETVLRGKNCNDCTVLHLLVLMRWRKMTGRHGNNPVRSDPCADCAVGSSPGSPPYRSGESKRSGLHDHQLAQIADHSLVRVYQRERKCLPETAREFRTQALRMCAILWRLREAARMRCCAAAKRTEISFRAGVARSLTIAIVGFANNNLHPP